jgi:hypothetical protein
MQHVQFDSFGEPLPQQVSEAALVRPVPRIAHVAGIGIFWSLVVVIVAARAFYFDPDFALHAGQIAEVVRSVRGALGV